MPVRTSHRVKQLAVATMTAGMGAAAALGLATGAGAETYGAGEGEGSIDAWSNYEWCPGDPIPQSDVPIPWALDGCHIWHYQTPTAENPSLYTPVEGRRPSQCPPFAWMCP